MKKYILILSAFLLSVNLLFAQGNIENNDLKPNGGLTLDVNFTPFDGANMISINALNGRFFFNENVALRLGIGVAYSADKYDNGKAGDNLITDKSSTFLFGLYPGIEKHFTGTEHLSPYIGAELLFTIFGANRERVEGSNIYEYSGATAYSDGFIENRKYTEFGLNLITGADYYFSKHIYLGLEIGLGFGIKSFGDVTSTVTDNSGSNSTSLTEGKESETHFGHNFKPALKLGFKF